MAWRCSNAVASLPARSVPVTGGTMSDTHTAGFLTRGHFPRLAFLLLAFVPIVANGIVALMSLEQVRLAYAQAQRAQQAITLLQQIEDLVEESGLDQRTYRLFGEAQYLDAYHKSQAELPPALLQLRELYAEDATTADRLDRLSSLIEQDSAALAASLTSMRLSDGTAGIPPELAEGVARTKRVEAAVDDVANDETNLLNQRLQAIASRNMVTFASVVLGTLGGIALVGVIFTLMRRDLRRTEHLAASRSGALEDSEQRFRRIFDESPIGKALADPDTLRIVQVNPAFSHMIGVAEEQIVGKTLLELAHIDDREVLHEAIRRGAGPNDDIEVRYVTQSRAIVWASVRLVQLSASDGRPAPLLALADNITREKRVEAELRQAQKMEAIGQLTGGIAHDFNNLLGVIIGNVEFLIDNMRDAEQAAMAGEILNSALSGADLTRRLLAFARRQTLQPRRIDLNAYLPSHIAILQRLLGESIAITTTLSDELWPIRADPSQIGDTLLNLVINARDAMPHGGTIVIATANGHLNEGEQGNAVAAGDYVVLSVTDSGTGMSPEVLERAVEPFFTTKGPGVGSGLGLSMIFGFANQSGGHLRIESELGRGTVVSLYLPRAQGAGPYEADDVSNAGMPQGSESILLVDDNVEMRAVARRHLVSLGYRVSEAATASAALEILRDGGGIDLLFTDMVMPGGLTGNQLAAAARHLRPGLKVLFTTGFFRPEPVPEPAQSPAETMIRKPYRRQDLAASVRAALEA
jgi:PAS domain S-box-containing protein